MTLSTAAKKAAKKKILEAAKKKLAAQIAAKKAAAAKLKATAAAKLKAAKLAEAAYQRNLAALERYEDSRINPPDRKPPKTKLKKKGPPISRERIPGVKRDKNGKIIDIEGT